MAIQDVLLNAGWIVGLGIGVFFIAKFLSKSAEKKAEIEEIKKTGSGLQKVYIQISEEEKKEEKEEAEEQAIEKKEEKEERKAEAVEEIGGGKKSKTSKLKKKIIKKTAKAAEIEKEAEATTTEIEKTIVAAVAGIQNETLNIKGEVENRKVLEAAEEKEEVQVAALANSIKNANKFGQINQRTANYFHKYFTSLDDHLKNQVSYEQQNEEHHISLAEHVKNSIAHLRRIIKRAQQADNKLNKKERKERKSFNQDIRSLKQLINSKKKNLRREERKGKKADPNLIIQLRKEIVILNRNEINLEILNKSVKETYNLLKKEIKQLRKLLREIIKLERAAKKYDRTLNKRGQEMKKRLSKLEQQQKKIEEAISKFEGASNIHALVLSFSQNLNEYFKIYEEIIKQDIGFEETLKNVLLNNIFVEKKMLAFVKLLTSLDESEKAIEEGVQATIQLVSVVFTDDVSGSLKKLSTEITKNAKILDYEEKVNQYLAAVIQEMEKETLAAEKEVEEIIKKDEKLIVENQALHEEEQTHLGDTMATMVNRKVAIDQTYLSQAKKLSNDLKQRNAQAAAAYKQATSI